MKLLSHNILRNNSSGVGNSVTGGYPLKITGTKMYFKINSEQGARSGQKEVVRDNEFGAKTFCKLDAVRFIVMPSASKVSEARGAFRIEEKK